MEIKYVNYISVEDYTRLRDLVGFGRIPLRQAAIGLQNTAYQVAAMDGEKTVGMARILWDGGYTAYLADVVVDPDYQGCHIGCEMVENIIRFLRSHLEPGEKVMLSLGAAKQKEPFYLKLGFQNRPNENQGAGMSQWLTK